MNIRWIRLGPLLFWIGRLGPTVVACGERRDDGLCVEYRRVWWRLFVRKYA